MGWKMEVEASLYRDPLDVGYICIYSYLDILILLSSLQLSSLTIMITLDGIMIRLNVFVGS